MGSESDFKHVLISDLMTKHIYTKEHEVNAPKALNDAILWDVGVALDPIVSSGARELFEAGRLAERLKNIEICERLEESAGSQSRRRQHAQGAAVGAYAIKSEILATGRLPARVRLGFTCKSCDFVYLDEPVTTCDCMPEKLEFRKGYFFEVNEQ